MESNTSTRNISLAALTSTVLPSGALIASALLAAAHIQCLEPPSYLPPSKLLDWYRAIYTAWVTVILLTPALCLDAWRPSMPNGHNYWRLFWTCSYFAYLIHFYWAVFVFFEGDIGAVFRSPMVSTPRFNFLLTFWWSFDMLPLWFFRSNPRWVRLQRAALHLVLLVAFFVGSVVEGQGLGRGLGMVMGASVVCCFVWRLVARAKERKSNLATQ